MTCRIPGCGQPAEGFGHYCNTHKSRERRHGHPRQDAITKTMLKPFFRSVTLRREANPEASAWVKMEAQWLALADQCRAAYGAYLRGTGASIRPKRIACQEITKVANAVEGREVVDIVLAMFLLRDQQPHRFRSDDAFVYQVVRRFRGLTDMNCGVWFDANAGREKRAYREMPPQVVEIMGRLIVEALGSAGLYLAKLERRDEAAQRQRAVELAQAMEELR